MPWGRGQVLSLLVVVVGRSEDSGTTWTASSSFFVILFFIILDSIYDRNIFLFQFVNTGPFKDGLVSGAVMGGPACDEVMKKIPGRQGHPGPHPWRGHEEKTWHARPSRIRDPPGWPRPLPHPVSSPHFCCCSCLPCCGFLCCLLRALLFLFHWMRTNLKP